IKPHYTLTITQHENSTPFLHNHNTLHYHIHTSQISTHTCTTLICSHIQIYNTHYINTLYVLTYITPTTYTFTITQNCYTLTYKHPTTCHHKSYTYTSQNTH